MMFIFYRVIQFLFKAKNVRKELEPAIFSKRLRPPSKKGGSYRLEIVREIEIDREREREREREKFDLFSLSKEAFIFDYLKWEH